MRYILRPGLAQLVEAWDCNSKAYSNLKVTCSNQVTRKQFFSVNSVVVTRNPSKVELGVRFPLNAYLGIFYGAIIL